MNTSCENLTKLENAFSDLYIKSKESYMSSLNLYQEKLEENFDADSIDLSAKLNHLLEVSDIMHIQTNLISLLAIFRQKVWERLHVVHWQKTPLVYRSLFGDISALLITISFLCRPGVEIEKLLFTADLGLLLGTPDSSDILNAIVSILSSTVSASKELPPSIASDIIPQKDKSICVLHDYFPARSFEDISVADQPPVVDFYEKHFVTQTPVVFTNCINDWPALTDPSRSWQNLTYISKVSGHRTVPIETGKSYLSHDAGTRLLTMEDFISKYILGSKVDSEKLPYSTTEIVKDESGYLAQHELLEQVPDLKKDIIIPDYCSLILDEDEVIRAASSTQSDELDSTSRDIMIQAWFGPLGTISPLHYDTYHNILVQLSGYKYIRLYPPSETEKLYPMVGRMSNNSQVDLAKLYESLSSSTSGNDNILQLYPLAAEAKYIDCIIGPGDMIYIPRWWWHFIQAVDEESCFEWEQSHLPGGFRVRPHAISPSTHSFSLSFWWSKRHLDTRDKEPYSS